MKTKLLTITAGLMSAISVYAQQLNVVTTTQNPTCSNNKGSACAQASGGSGSYKFKWSNGGTGSCIQNLSAGTYTLLVNDNQNTDSVVKVINIQSPSPITVATSQNCDSLNTSAIVFGYAAGGTPPYIYKWNGMASQGNSKKLSNGQYFIQVVDANGCSTYDTVKVNCKKDTNLVVSASVTNNATCGQANGSINAYVSGGTGNYTYSWSLGSAAVTSSTQNTIFNLSAGTYTLTVIDAYGATAVTMATITTTSSINLSTYSGCDTLFGGGYATAIPNGGTPPYQYMWSNGANSPSLNGLTNGYYHVNVYDANQCAAYDSIYVFCQDTATYLTVDITLLGNSSCGNNNGFACATANGGTQPYNYVWSVGGATSACIQGLAAGTYTVTVFDSQQSSATTVVTISTTFGPPISTYAGCDSINGGGYASVYSLIMPPNVQYTYMWSNGATSPSINGLANGVYFVTVYDNNGCSSIDSLIVACNAGVVCNAQLSLATAFGCSCNNEGYGVVAVAGGTAPYQYMWSNGDNTAAINGIVNGMYTVTVKDVNGCSAQTAVTIYCDSNSTTGIQPITNGTNSNLKVYPNPATDNTTIQFETSENGNTVVTVYDVLGNKVADLVNEQMNAGTHKTQFNTTNLSSGMYFVRVIADGKSTTSHLSIVK